MRLPLKRVWIGVASVVAAFAAMTAFGSHATGAEVAGHVAPVVAEDAGTTGEKSVLVLAVDFADLPGWPMSIPDGGARLSADALRARMEDDVAPFIAANSYGRTTLAVTVADSLYRMPEPAATYAGSFVGDTQLHEHAIAAASVHVDAGAFDVVIVVHSDLSTIPESRMTFESRAPVGGWRIWINGHPGFAQFARSLGHCFGLYEARVSAPGREPFSSDGNGEWEADPLDVMGAGAHPGLHFSAIYKAQLGWLPETAIRSVDTSGVFRLFRMDALEPAVGQLAALRLPSRNGISYWVGYRRPAGPGGSVADGIHVHQVFDSGAAVAHLLDLSPDTPNDDVALGVGSRATDSFRGISFETLRTGVEGGLDYVDVEVSLEPGSAAVWTWGEEAPATPEVENAKRIVADGSGIRVLHHDGTISGWHVPSEPPDDLGPVVAIASDRWDGYWAGAVLADGRAALWNFEDGRSELYPPDGLNDVRALAISVYQAAALNADGTVQVWGRVGPFIAVPAGLSQVVAVEASQSGTCAVSADGTVASWGYLPAVPSGLNDVVAVSPTTNYVAVLRRDGTVAAWGEGFAGLQRLLPGVGDARSIAFHDDGGLVLREDGSIVAWSRHADPTPAFTVPDGLPPAVQVAAGMGISAILAAQGAPAITIQPGSRTSALGGSADFTTFAAGDGAIAYRWQRLRPGHVTWTDLAESGGYSGTLTPTLRVANIARRQSGERFRCIATGASGTAVTSDAAQLLVPNALIGIATQPQGGTIAEHETAVLSVQPYGESPFTYQWLHDGSPVDGATGPRLSLADVTAAAAGAYAVRVGNAHGTATSNTVTIVVLTAPAFTSEPDDRTASPGDSITWTVTATGAPEPALQWRKGGADIPGSTGATLALAGVVLSDAGEYTVVATNDVGAVTSRTATLTVQATHVSGQYLGTFGEDGAWAVDIDGTNAGRCLIWPGPGGVALVGTFEVAVDGSFEGDAVAAAHRRVSGAPGSEAAPIVARVTGVIAGREVRASIAGIAGDLIATREPEAGDAEALCGYFEAPFLDAEQGMLHLVVGASGRALVIVAGDGVGTGGLARMDGLGEFVLVDPAGVEVRAQVRPGSLDLQGSIVLPQGGGTIRVSGVSAQVEPVSRLVNLSTRGHVGLGENVLVVGFVLAGTGTKPLLIRAVGPSLASEPFNVGGAAGDPRIHLVRQADGMRLDGNDNWGEGGGAAGLADAMARAGAFPVPEGSGDAAMLVELPAGAYTVLVESGSAGPGVSLAEVYAVDDAVHAEARLVNISTRGYVGSGDAVMIAGFVAEGNVPRRLLVRGVGPSLGLPPFNVGGVQPDPVIAVHRASDGERVAVNDDWDTEDAGESVAELARTVGAFPLPRGSRDAALVITIPARTGYTVVISGNEGAAGVVLAEVYELP